MKRIIIFSLVLTAVVFGQSFGQNKVQYKNFKWSYIESPHFDIYYYGGETDLADFTAKVAEDSYEQVSKHLRWEINKRVSIIVYHSHNDFQQTNVVWAYMSEGIGGVTELFKNRVVVPFEGSYSQFRHVIHHELVHAVINDMIYGGSIQSIISGRVRLNIPLWANEGLAEYLSSDWDTRADMMLRDLAVHEYIPQVEELNYYFAYKGGQSLWRFIAEKYGREKIGEVFEAMKRSQNAKDGFQKALGMDYDALTKQWHKYLKKEYWPDVAGREELDDFGKPLTDHEKDKNFYNISPSLSPDGSKIVMLTDKSGYADIVMIDAIDGRHLKTLVKGNRSVDFEELKWLQPGVSWSPDGKQVVIAAKAGHSDALYLINVDTGKRKKLRFDLDGLFTAAWSPDGNSLAFVGSKGKSSDIYLYNIESEELVNLTDDIYSDSEPSWSPDGKTLAFVSDRRNLNSQDYIEDNYQYGLFQTDIYKINVASREIKQITATDYNENYPIWANTSNKLLYTADFNGVWNLHLHNLDSGEYYPVTNVLTGIYQLSLSEDDRTLVFSGYSEWGWDIFSYPNPLDLQEIAVAPTNYILNRDDHDDTLVDMRASKKKKSSKDYSVSMDYSGFIFAEEYEQHNEAVYQQNKPIEAIPADSNLTPEGEFITHDYKTRFSLDVVNGQATFSNVFGYSGTTMFMFSDILGDHQIVFGTELVLTLKNSDYFFTYAYLKRRADFYITGFHTANLFGNGYSYFSRLRNYGFSLGVSVPMSRYNRFEGELTWSQVQYSSFVRDFDTNSNIELDQVRLNTVLPSVGWVFDNSIYGSTGPVDGYRHNLNLRVSPKSGKDGLDFTSVIFDARKYYRFKRDYSLAGRIMIGKSIGPDAQKFLLGGVPNWLYGYGETNGVKDEGSYRQDILASNEDDSEEDIKNNMLRDAYFSVFAMPVRGTRYYERFGTNLALMNLEIRFPFINYFALGFPMKMIFANIRGHAFLDMGAAWDDWDELSNSALMSSKYRTNDKLKPVVSSFGYGIKINLGYFLLRIDSAWDINENGYSRPQYYLSLGADW